MLTSKICQDCGATFQGGQLGRYCMNCRKRRSGESAKRRRLCNIGAAARWGKKQTDAGEPPPEWVGPSAELKQKEGS